MKIKSIILNKKNRPDSVIVKMSLDEAAAIAKVFGGFSYQSFSERVPQLDGSLHSEVYDCLVGELFNRYYDDGVDGHLNGDDSFSGA